MKHEIETPDKVLNTNVKTDPARPETTKNKREDRGRLGKTGEDRAGKTGERTNDRGRPGKTGDGQNLTKNDWGRPGKTREDLGGEIVKNNVIMNQTTCKQRD